MKDIWCVGSLGVDIIIGPISGPPRMAELVIASNLTEDTGGCAGNVARTIAKIGGNSKLIARVGGDQYGNFAIRTLKKDGVDTRQIVQDANAKTGVSIILVHSSGERSFIYAPGANYELDPDDVLPRLEKMIPGDIIHFSDTFLLPLLDGTPTRDLLLRAKNAGIVTSLDTSWDTSGRWLNMIETYFPYLDYFFTNLDEAQQLFPGMHLSSIVSNLSRRGVKNVIIKMGAQGVLIKEETKRPYKLLPSERLKPVDTTGAGDSFVAAFLTALQSRLTVRDAALFSTRVAEQNIMEYGAHAGVPRFKSFKAARKQFLEKGNSLC